VGISFDDVAIVLSFQLFRGELEFAVAMVEALSKTNRIDILMMLLSSDQSKGSFPGP
jgi:hypothetical protein